ncbi:hypothetical protein TSUD_340400 [Trifolium subterraneum]|uniref:Late embryogenesis abundant protein LEA-2 subgroup domain-containing protein n=1 Tax=Trifolium subterraneum TaxID=3900 RepID=A0A2Z6LNE6_TRISU|nr:hypothetical protein TSUD_340400 [Trifolium subterraneum]
MGSDSSSDSDSPKHGKSHKSKSKNKASTSEPSPPPVAAPHTMYYQSSPGYPGPPPYPGYPPPPHGYPPYPPQGYNNYPGQIHAPYYSANPNYHHHGDGGAGFIRGFIMCSCFIFTGFFVSTLIIALMLHPQLPIYSVNSLSVANFNTNPMLTGDWNISISVHNPNDRLKGYFQEFKVDIVHESNEIAASAVPNFELEKEEQKQMDVRASSNNGAIAVSFQKWDLDKMSKERSSGSLMVGVRIASMTEFKSPSLTTRSTGMLASCQGLKVVFQGATGNGMLDNKGIPINCTIYM